MINRNHPPLLFQSKSHKDPPSPLTSSPSSINTHTFHNKLPTLTQPLTPSLPLPILNFPQTTELYASSLQFYPTKAYSRFNECKYGLISPFPKTPRSKSQNPFLMNGLLIIPTIPSTTPSSLNKTLTIDRQLNRTLLRCGVTRQRHTVVSMNGDID